MDEKDPRIDYLKIDVFIRNKDIDSFCDYCHKIGCEMESVFQLWFDASMNDNSIGNICHGCAVDLIDCYWRLSRRTPSSYYGLIIKAIKNEKGGIKKEMQRFVNQCCRLRDKFQ